MRDAIAGRPGGIRGRDAAILAIILTSYVMIVLDISVVITGLPLLAAELNFTAAGLSWVQSLYTLTLAALGLGVTTAIAAMGAGGLAGTALLLHRTHLGLMAATAMLALAWMLMLRLCLKFQSHSQGNLI